MCLAKQLQQLMTCKCCCASSDSRKLQCNFLNSATTVSQTLVIMQKKKKYIYILDICSVYTEHFPGVGRLMDICIFRKNRIHDTGDAPLTVIKSRPLLDKWLWPALYGSDQSKICLIERWIGLICRIKRAWPIRLVHRLTGCKTSTDRLFHRFVYGIIEATQHG